MKRDKRKVRSDQLVWQCDYCKAIKKDPISNKNLLKKMTLCLLCGRYSQGEIGSYYELRQWQQVRGRM